MNNKHVFENKNGIMSGIRPLTIIFLIFICSIICGISGLFPLEKAEAAIPQLSFEENRYSLAVGNTRRINLFFGEEEVDVRSDAFKWHGGYFENSDENVVYIDSSGNITCIGAGTAVITAHFQGVTAKARVKVRDNKFSISRKKAVIYQGEQVRVKLTGPRKAYSYEYSIRKENQSGPVSKKHASCSVKASSKGKFTITGERPGTDYIDLIINAKNGESYSRCCTVEVLPCGLTEHELIIEKGKTAELPLTDAEPVSIKTNFGCTDGEEWALELPVLVDSSLKTVTGVEICSADYLITYKTPSGTELSDTIKISIIEPVDDSEDGQDGDSDNGEDNADDETSDAEDLTIDISEKTVFLAKGKSKKLKISELPEDEMVKYSSSDTSVVKVSKNGKLTAMGYGSAYVTADTESKRYYIAVNVGTEVCIDAVKWGLKQVGKAQYSQARRMEEGYFDCSSFTWRSFNAAGFHLADANNYAPASADLAQWLADNGYAIDFGPTDFTELLPGDLVFTTTGSNNGRYLRIDHVAVYYGQEIVDENYHEYYTSEGGEVSGIKMVGRIVHAGSWGGGIYISDYPGSGTVVMTARPVRGE